jgi:hypothetical protein
MFYYKYGLHSTKYATRREMEGGGGENRSKRRVLRRLGHRYAFLHYILILGIILFYI